MNRKLTYVMIAIASLALLSCERDPLSPDEGTDGGTVVKLRLGGDNTLTKSGLLPESSETKVIANLSDQFGSEGMILTETVSSMDDFQPMTKGTPVYTENLADVYSGDIVPLAVYDTNTGAERSDLKASFSKAADSNVWSYSYYVSDWGQKKFTYYVAIPSSLPEYVETPSIDKTVKSITFSLVEDKYPTTAVEQNDLLFTSKDVTVNPGGTSNNDLLLYHVFAAVKFKVGKIDDSFTITKVELTNMYTQGTCKVTPNYPSDVTDSNAGGADATKSSSCSVWSSQGGRKTFSQTFAGTKTLTSENSNFASSFYNRTTAENNLIATAGDTEAKATFMCIPMAFSSSTTSTQHTNLVITYKDAKDVAKTATVDLSTALDGKEWKAGQLYTYSLTVNDVTVEVTDEVSGDTVSNLLITNTGNMDGYIRATITANWVKDMTFSDGTTRAVVVHELNRPSEVLATNFQNLAPSDSWKKADDLFFYYRYPVQGGQSTNVPLFTSYKVHDVPASALASETVPIDGCYIQLTVSAQIVSAKGRSGNLVTGPSTDNVKNAWNPGTEVINWLSTETED